MFKKPKTQVLKETIVFIKEDWRKVVGYFFMALTFGVAFIWVTLHGINNELSTHWVFKAYLFSFITGITMWFFIKNEAKSAEKSRVAARNAAKSRKVTETKVDELTSELAKANAKIAEMEQQMVNMAQWNERSQRANQTLAKELKTAKRTIARLTAPTKVVSVKISSSNVNPECKDSSAPHNEDVTDIDAIFSLMQKN